MRQLRWASLLNNQLLNNNKCSASIAPSPIPRAHLCNFRRAKCEKTWDLSALCHWRARSFGSGSLWCTSTHAYIDSIWGKQGSVLQSFSLKQPSISAISELHMCVFSNDAPITSLCIVFVTALRSSFESSPNRTAKGKGNGGWGYNCIGEGVTSPWTVHKDATQHAPRFVKDDFFVIQTKQKL